MLHPKLISSGLMYSNGYAFAIGGNNEGICERFNIESNVWQKIPSFSGKIHEETSLYTYTCCLVK